MAHKKRFEKTNPIYPKTVYDSELQPYCHNTRLRRDLKACKSQSLGAAVPSRGTRKAFTDTDAGRNLVVCEDVEDLFKRLGI